jgi:hypothetical protein
MIRATVGIVAIALAALALYVAGAVVIETTESMIHTPEVGRATDQVTLLQTVSSALGTTAGLGTLVTVTGILHTAFEVPTCLKDHPSCGIPSFEFPYITATDGENYRLLGSQPLYLDGTRIVVTGWLQKPSAWQAGALYAPPLTFAGDITVTSIEPET